MCHKRDIIGIGLERMNFQLWDGDIASYMSYRPNDDKVKYGNNFKNIWSSFPKDKQRNKNLPDTEIGDQINLLC